MKQGFTLIELMIVIVIVGILAAIAIPKFSNVSESARQSACRSNQRLVVQGLNVYMAEHDGEYPVLNTATWVDPILDGYVPQDMECQTAKVKYAFAVYKYPYQNNYMICSWGVGSQCWLNHGYIWFGDFVNWD